MIQMICIPVPFDYESEGIWSHETAGKINYTKN
jgi:hypothetical protein